MLPFLYILGLLKHIFHGVLQSHRTICDNKIYTIRISRRAENPRYIDLVNQYRLPCFQNKVTVTTGLSDFHKMVTSATKTVFESYFLKKKMIQSYYKNLINTGLFKRELETILNANSNVIWEYKYF